MKTIFATLVAVAAFGSDGAAMADSGEYCNSSIQAMLDKFFSVKSQKGVTMIEYALIAGLVAIVVVGALTALGGNLTTIFTNISTALTGAGN
jgi:pilus assembly protein Flp/PilA